jgi:hypothetical protein
VYVTSVAREESKELQLFSPTAIAVLAFFFSAITGAVLLALNEREMRRDIGGYIAAAVIGLPVMLIAYIFMPSFLTLLINLGLIYLVRKLAQDQEGDAMVAGYYVTAKNAGIGIAVGFGVLFAAFMVGAVLVGLFLS